MRFDRNTKGQFIIIAVMMIALMIISLGATFYTMGNYYKQEQWEDYTTVIENVKQGTIDIVDISLANYTASDPPLDMSIIEINLDFWQYDLIKAYPGYGIVLTYDLANGNDLAYDTSINYVQGLAHQWNQPSSFSAVKATVTLNMTSIGLEGYRFVATSFLELTILEVDNSSKLLRATVLQDGKPVTGLNEDNFEVENFNIIHVASDFVPQYELVYTILCDNLESSSATLTVTDQRGIKVVATK
jgi:hypothetical protein